MSEQGALPVGERSSIVPEYDDLIAAGREQLWRWRLDDALAAFEAALRLRPQAAAAHYLRGEALFLARRLDEALDSHVAAARHGVARDGIVGTAMSGMVPGDFAWMCHMLRGDFASAWRLADADRERRRHAGIDCTGWPRHMRPVWDGTTLDGRRVLVRCYHGLGDTIQFARYLPILAERTRSVSLETQPELLELLSTIPGIARLVALSPRQHRSPADLDCDTEIDATELPYAFRTALATVPAPGRVLRPDPARLTAMRQRFGSLAGRLKIGLVWASGAWKPERSIAIECLAPLRAIPGIAFIALQRGVEYDRWRRDGGGLQMVNGFASDDIAETAAAIAALDLVITVDTLVAHLAGALGAPVWVMLHSAADWRWLLDGGDSPWYPTMRLFRQPAPGDWAGVVAEVATGLSALAGASATSPVAARGDRSAAGAAAPPRR